ncbi:hypothetical protein TRFO_17606 [Tritrichomonas foetus]|uniref:DUF3447 domain-containing protein n=1 Tax=Tritrichomonas foetus TaxID=1144522 RepID=A0A1J4KML2_9EUKA|nr:hypothetical protein TRFO_17606 [Tritrichomonas foetus]|eukprot:OHT12467.1 hypothetical protein TRFO_17606 [Tritrichomonas foetus]
MTLDEKSDGMSLEALQKVLYNINEDNIKESSQAVVNSVYCLSEKQFAIFFNQLIKAVPFRTERMDYIVDFFIEIIEQSPVAKNSISLSLGIEPLLPLQCDLYSDLINPIACFYSKLEKRNVFSFEEYAKQFFNEYIVQLWKKYIIVTSRLFHWFIEKFLVFDYPDWKRPEGYSTLYFNNYNCRSMTVHNIIEHMLFSAETYHYFDFDEIDDLDEYTKAYILKYLSDQKIPHNDATDAIMKDDIDLLQYCVSITSNFDFNGDIRCNIFNNNIMLFDEPLYNKHYHPKKVSFVQLAALFQSVSCFKYLMLNNADLKDTMDYAIAGGNIEIIRLLENTIPKDENEEKEWEVAAVIAITYHHNNILEWIFETKNSNFISIERIITIARDCNVWAYNFIIEKQNQLK